MGTTAGKSFAWKLTLLLPHQGTCDYLIMKTKERVQAQAPAQTEKVVPTAKKAKSSSPPKAKTQPAPARKK